jgi:signal transduction histidine kinase
VTRESERLNKIISDFLIYSREKKLKLNQENLVTLLEDTLTLLQNHPRMTARAQEGRITIVRNFHESVAMARVDGDKMKQVFWNLCENAFHALPEGGALTVSLFRENDKWVISFADNGAGIASAQLGKLFEPFQSQFEGGTGLGLAIVYQIVQAHQGAISASSAPGQGADFRVELPCAQASTGATSDNAAMASAVTHG